MNFRTLFELVLILPILGVVIVLAFGLPFLFDSFVGK